MNLRPVVFLALLLLIVGLSGCVTVQPWERGILSDPMMIFNENALDKGIQEHHFDFREGSVGGTGSQGGGCGCG